MSISETIGKNFDWFVGQVALGGAQDPEKEGRIKVRIIDEYADKVEDSDMIWCRQLMPCNNASKEGKGWLPTGIEAGTYVIGFYLDGKQKSIPMIIGTFHLQNRYGELGSDVNPIAKGNNPVQKEYDLLEPRSKYAAVYPFNKVYESTSGHVIEVDDTPSAERIHIYHTSGSYIEMGPDGEIVTKATNHAIVATDNATIKTNNHSVISNSSEEFTGTKDISSVTTSMSSFVNTDITSDVNINVQAPVIHLNGTTISRFTGDLTVSIEAPVINLKGIVLINGRIPVVI